MVLAGAGMLCCPNGACAATLGLPVHSSGDRVHRRALVGDRRFGCRRVGLRWRRGGLHRCRRGVARWLRSGGAGLGAPPPRAAPGGPAAYPGRRPAESRQLRVPLEVPHPPTRAARRRLPTTTDFIGSKWLCGLHRGQKPRRQETGRTVGGQTKMGFLLCPWVGQKRHRAHWGFPASVRSFGTRRPAGERGATGNSDQWRVWVSCPTHGSVTRARK